MEIEIPAKYKILTKVDWNRGDLSRIPFEQRLEMHRLWLEYQHWQIKHEITERVKVIDKPVVGFID